MLALAVLGIVNTGLAYWLFYLLIDHAGAATASVITYVMPVVALLLGASLLAEPVTVGAVAGLILIALGAWLATRRPGAAAAGGPEPGEEQQRGDLDEHGLDGEGGAQAQVVGEAAEQAWENDDHDAAEQLGGGAGGVAVSRRGGQSGASDSG